MDLASLKIAYDIFQKVGGLIKPKKRDDIKALKENKVLQKSIFGDNYIVLTVGNSKDHILTKPDDLPDELINRIKGQFKEKKLNTKVEGIRLISPDFSDEMRDFEKHFSRKMSDLEAIEPFLDKEYKSVLKLSHYVGTLLKQGKHDEEKKVRDDIEKHYGKNGRRLCNLYLTGYINKLVSFIKSDEMKKCINPKELKSFINSVIKDMIADRSIFFIKEYDSFIKVSMKISRLFEKERPYIAIHSAGYKNVHKAKKIIDVINADMQKYGYRMKEKEHHIQSASCPLFYVEIVKRQS